LGFYSLCEDVNAEGQIELSFDFDAMSLEELS
jgi:hypothetical protein